MDRQLPTLKRKKIVEADKPKVVDFSSQSNPQGYFHQQIRHGDVVIKITSTSKSGPFYSRKYTDFGGKATEENSRHKTLKGAYAWAQKHLAGGVTVKTEDIDTEGKPDAVPDYDMAEGGSGKIVPDLGLDDRLFTEDDEDEKIVPSEVAVSGRSYTI